MTNSILARKSIDKKFREYLVLRAEQSKCSETGTDSPVDVDCTRIDVDARQLMDINMHLSCQSTDEMPLLCSAVGQAVNGRFSLSGGAVLISTRIAITAAHLFEEMKGSIPEEVLLHVGSHDLRRGKKIPVKDVLYSEILSRFDIALLVLHQDERVKPEFATSIIDVYEFADLQQKSEIGLTAGWGYTRMNSAGSSKKLRDLAMRIGPCNAFPNFPIPTMFRVKSCNGGGPCEKDSGSGFFVLDSSGTIKLAGIQSMISNTGKSCHTHGYPALFSNISQIATEICSLAEKFR